MVIHHVHGLEEENSQDIRSKLRRELHGDDELQQYMAMMNYMVGGGGGVTQGCPYPISQILPPNIPYPRFFYPQYPISQIFYPTISHIPDFTVN